MRQSPGRTFNNLAALVLLWIPASPLAAQSVDRCVRPDDFYSAPASGLSVVDLGPVKVFRSGLPDGTPVLLSVDKCNRDPGLDVIIPWSEKGAAPPASISFKEACPPGLPVKAFIEFQIGVASATWRAFDASGALVDTQVTPASGGMQSVTLASSAGIREVTVESAEICISTICFSCERTPECENQIRPSDFFAAPASGLHTVVLGPVVVQEARLPGGAAAPLAIADCDRDGSLDLVIPWSGSTAAPPAAFYLDRACRQGSFPTRVEIGFRQGVPKVEWRAYDPTGTLVDSETTLNPHVDQTVVLESPSGIVRVVVDGAELCVSRICYRCEEVPDCENGVRPFEFFAAPAGGLATVVMGPVRVEQAKLPTGAPAPLSIKDSSGDGKLDLTIPWSGPSATPPASIKFERACREGEVPTRVEITYLQGVPAVEWRAYDPANVLVDSVTTAAPPALHTAVLESPAGIVRVEVTGAELCITRICWSCGRRTPPPDDCESVGRRFPRPVRETLAVELGAVAVTAARLPGGEPVPMSVADCDGDGVLDLSIPWSGAGASPRATVHLKKVCGTGLPVAVALRILTDNAVIHAYDSAGVEVDSDAAGPPYAVHTLVVTSPGGIARVEIEGSQMCLIEVCWKCDDQPPPKRFHRGDSNGSGTVDLSDAVHALQYLFIGGAAPSCGDATDSNDDGRIDLSDPTAVLNYLFLGSRPLPGGLDCSADPTEDDLVCPLYSSCE